MKEPTTKLIATKATIYHVNGETESREYDMAARPSFKEIAAIVEPLLDSGGMEHVLVFHGGEYLDMFVDEVGVLIGLPRNFAATAIYRNNALTHEPGKFKPEDLPAIHGNAVLFHRRIWF